MAKKWKSGDYIPVEHINFLEERHEKLTEIEKRQEKEKKNVSKNKS